MRTIVTLIVSAAMVPALVVPQRARADNGVEICHICSDLYNAQGVKIADGPCKPVPCPSGRFSPASQLARVGAACLIQQRGRRDRQGTITPQHQCDTGTPPKVPYRVK